MAGTHADWLKFGTLVAIAFVFDWRSRLRSTCRRRAGGGDAGGATPSPEAAPQLSAPALKSAGDFQDAFVAVAEHVKPAVVFIRSQHVERGDNQRLPPGFQDFFPNLRRRPQVEQGSGSGFIVSPDGLHPHQQSRGRGRRQGDRAPVRQARVHREGRGHRSNTDVAVIKIDARALPSAGFGNSDSARVGEWVLAIGNPLGEAFAFTVTAGIVSAKGRLLAGLQQTRYAISGLHPDRRGDQSRQLRGAPGEHPGQVIGINSAIASENRVLCGYGFAIPMNLARTVMDQLVKTGRVERAVMGSRSTMLGRRTPTPWA